MYDYEKIKNTMWNIWLVEHWFSRAMIIDLLVFDFGHLEVLIDELPIEDLRYLLITHYEKGL